VWNWANWCPRFHRRLPLESAEYRRNGWRWRHQNGFTLLESLLALTLLAIVVAGVSNWTISFLKQENRWRNELLLQSESLLFFHNLALELRAAERLEMRNRMLYATVPELADPAKLTWTTVSYQYYLDTEGRFVRRIQRQGSYEGYTIMLQHIQQLHMEIQADGSLQLAGRTALGEAVHSFAWTVVPRLGGRAHATPRGTGERAYGDARLLHADFPDGGRLDDELAGT